MIETLFEKNNDRKCPQPGEGKSQAHSGSAEAPNKMNSKRHKPRHIIIKTPSFKDRERILKAAKEKQEVK